MFQSSLRQSSSMSRQVILAILLFGVILVKAVDHEDDVCPSEGMENVDFQRVGGKSWYLAYLFPAAPAVSFFQSEKCLKLDATYYPNTNQIGLKMQGLDKDNEQKEFDEALFNVRGSGGFGVVDGLYNVFSFLYTNYDDWLIGKNCFSKNNTIIEELWWVATIAPDGSLGSEDSVAAFNQYVTDEGMTHYFTEQHSLHLEQCQK